MCNLPPIIGLKRMKNTWVAAPLINKLTQKALKLLRGKHNLKYNFSS